MNEKKEGRKPLFRSEFSMGQLDFERYHALFQQADQSGIELRQGVDESLWKLHSVLLQIYLNFAPVLGGKLRKEVDDMKAQLTEKIKGIHKNPHYRTEEQKKAYDGAVELIFEFDLKLRDAKQLLGLGIQVEAKPGSKSKMSGAVMQ